MRTKKITREYMIQVSHEMFSAFSLLIEVSRLRSSMKDVVVIHPSESSDRKEQRNSVIALKSRAIYLKILNIAKTNDW